MALKLITPPPVEPVTADEVKAFARVDFDDEDQVLDSLIAAAREHVEQVTGRQLVVATYDHVRDNFPHGCSEGIRLPISPLHEVEGVFYISPDTGLEVELPAEEYEVDTISQPGWVMPGNNGWPCPMATINAVRVRFVAGYEPEEDGSPVDYTVNIPARAKLAVKALALHWYDNRSPVEDKTFSTVPMHVQRLLAGFRVWGA
jgi:uncharacterized phiE125 gp8 family phage protein